jgi:soluble lytic murein transglycosylase-like protein
MTRIGDDAVVAANDSTGVIAALRARGLTTSPQETARLFAAALQSARALPAAAPNAGSQAGEGSGALALLAGLQRDGAAAPLLPGVMLPPAGSRPLATRSETLAGAASAATEAALPYREMISRAATRYGIDPALITSVISVESRFDPRAVSPAGAKGLMQLMDATAQGLGVTDSFDPVQNVFGGAKLLRSLLDRYQGNLSLALAAYNAGPGAVDTYGGIPPYAETQQYVRRVTAALASHEERRAAGFEPVAG